jgi:hypothetical protein
MALQVGDMPVGLGKMFLFLSHRFEPTPRSPAESPGRFLAPPCICDIRAA